jgi:outer membrane protein assembly factor BamB
MPLEQLIFLGLVSHVVAVHRESGEVVWVNDELKAGFKSILPDGDRLIVLSGGRLYCLSPFTGKILWENRLKGYSASAVASLASIRNRTDSTAAQAASDQDQAALAASIAAFTATM